MCGVVPVAATLVPVFLTGAYRRYRGSTINSAVLVYTAGRLDYEINAFRRAEMKERQPRGAAPFCPNLSQPSLSISPCDL